jgi:hypothetical protein
MMSSDEFGELTQAVRELFAAGGVLD